MWHELVHLNIRKECEQEYLLDEVKAFDFDLEKPKNSQKRKHYRWFTHIYFEPKAIELQSGFISAGMTGLYIFAETIMVYRRKNL